MPRPLQLRCNKARRRSPADKLGPLFSESPPGERDFVRLPVILQFVENIRFQKCKAVASDTCSCGKKPNKVVSPGHECKNKLHWHHFCTAHVSAWLTKYMIPAILLKESKEMFSANVRSLQMCIETIQTSWNIIPLNVRTHKCCLTRLAIVPAMVQLNLSSVNSAAYTVP
ncbi:unnamed protein product [Colias eurytheme]|nr:unnamed protein product [Colias eurytheme]